MTSGQSELVAGPAAGWPDRADRVADRHVGQAGRQRAIRHLLEDSVDISIYQRRRDIFCQGLEAAGYEFEKPEGAFYLFPRTPVEDDAEFVSALQEENILTVPGKGFGGPGHFRIAYCVEDKVIERAMPGFKRVMEKYR